MGIINWIKSINKRSVQVLLYHRVCEVDSDPQQLCVSPKNFLSQMEYLKENFPIIKLSDLDNMISNGEAPIKSMAVTFDDGYLDNLQYAKPILEQLDIPATFFITSGYIGKDMEFYQETLNRIFLQKEILPLKLTVNIEGQVFNYNNLEKPSNRKNAYEDLHFALRSKKELIRKTIIQELINWSQLGFSPNKNYMNLNEDELIDLAKGNLFDIGAHSINHLPLSILTEDEQEKEIFNSKYNLEKILNDDVTLFAYPYGTKDDYNHYSMKLVSKNNYLLACSNYPGIVSPSTSRYEIPRMVVRDWDITEFKDFISKNFEKYQ